MTGRGRAGVEVVLEVVVDSNTEAEPLSTEISINSLEEKIKIIKKERF